MKRAIPVVILVAAFFAELKSGDECSHQLRLVVRRSTDVIVQPVLERGVRDEAGKFTIADVSDGEYSIQWRCTQTGQKISVDKRYTSLNHAMTSPMDNTRFGNMHMDIMSTRIPSGEFRFRIPEASDKSPLPGQSFSSIQFTVVDAF